MIYHQKSIVDWVINEDGEYCEVVLEDDQIREEDLEFVGRNFRAILVFMGGRRKIQMMEILVALLATICGVNRRTSFPKNGSGC